MITTQTQVVIIGISSSERMSKVEATDVSFSDVRFEQLGVKFEQIVMTWAGLEIICNVNDATSLEHKDLQEAILDGKESYC